MKVKHFEILSSETQIQSEVFPLVEATVVFIA